MIAFISDIHGNTEALSEVLSHAKGLGVARYICLGDVIGYGPEPRECLETIMDLCEYTLLGNHEHAAMYYASDFNPKARAAIEWTKEELNNPAYPKEENFRLWNYISEMVECKIDGGMYLVHGSPRDPVREYMLPGDAQDITKMTACFQIMGESRICFVGHSHVPGVYEEGCDFQSPQELESHFELREKKAIVNIGSIGQPRDGDPRASYVTYEEESRRLRFHRLPYEVEKTVAKIRATELPGYLADRLLVGR